MSRFTQFWNWIRKPQCHDDQSFISNEPSRLLELTEAPLRWFPAETVLDPRVRRVPVGAITRRTGPLEVLQGRRVLAVFDCENLSISARERSLRLSYRRLLKALRSTAESCEAHGFFSRRAGDTREDRALQRAGYHTHPRNIEVLRLRGGIRKTLANSDSRLLFMTGSLMSQSDADTLLIASGDGDLGCELARGIQTLSRPWTVITLSLAGTSSRRLNAESNLDIHANLEIGRDVLQPIGPAMQSGNAPRVRLADSPPCRGANTRFVHEPQPRLLPIREAILTHPIPTTLMVPVITDEEDNDILFPEPQPAIPPANGPLGHFLRETRQPIGKRRWPPSHTRA